MSTREAIVISLGIIVSGILIHALITKNKPHVPTTNEIFITNCSERGGDPVVTRDWGDTDSVQTYKCEGKEE